MEARRERGRIAARGVSCHGATMRRGPSGSDDPRHGPRPVHRERHNWPGRASPSPVTSSAGHSTELWIRPWARLPA